MYKFSYNIMLFSVRVNAIQCKSSTYESFFLLSNVACRPVAAISRVGAKEISGAHKQHSIHSLCKFIHATKGNMLPASKKVTVITSVPIPVESGMITPLDPNFCTSVHS